MPLSFRENSAYISALPGEYLMAIGINEMGERMPINVVGVIVKFTVVP